MALSFIFILEAIRTVLADVLLLQLVCSIARVSVVAQEWTDQMAVGKRGFMHLPQLILTVEFLRFLGAAFANVSSWYAVCD